ncbi:patatin-like phospholipase family protein [candidate division KSB1 bacterium]|nr:patatin-like phospholipase family protein [candidate division KSB1 bacterium]
MPLCNATLAIIKKIKTYMKRIGLTLGSGGAKGLSHIAFIQALDEMGIKPSIISGTSIGAIIGAFYAAGVTGKQMQKILSRVKFRDINKMMDFSIRKNSAMLKGDGIENFFYRHIPVCFFSDLEIPLKIVATDFWNRQEVVLDSGDLIFAMRASMSLPVIFKPVQTGSTVLMDGGMVNPLPYDIIRDQCDILIAIDVSGEKTPRQHANMPRMVESIMSSFQIMQASIVQNKMKTSSPDIYIKPMLRNIRVLNFDKYEEIISGVKDDVRRFQMELDQILSKNKIFSLFGK